MTQKSVSNAFMLDTGVFRYRKRNTFANKQLILLYLKFSQEGSFKLEEQTKKPALSVNT